MTIEFDCPGCRERIRVPDAAAGKKARCPKCSEICTVPMELAADSSADFGSGPAGGFGSGPTPSQPYATSSPSPFQNPPPVAGANPYGDPTPAAGSNPFGASPNPYASPAFAGQAHYQQLPLTRDETRQKLLGPAIGMIVGALCCLGYMTFSILMTMVSAGGQQFGNDAEKVGFFVGILVAAVILGLPYVVVLVGATAMLRGSGHVAAWAGAIAALLPCNLCCFITLGFGIWAIVVLSDPRVNQALKQS